MTTDPIPEDEEQVGTPRNGRSASPAKLGSSTPRESASPRSPHKLGAAGLNPPPASPRSIVLQPDTFPVPVLGWVLYTQWPLFRTAVLEGLGDPVRNKEFSLPDEFPGILAIPLIQYLYSRMISPIFRSFDNAIYVLRNAQALSLTAPNSKGVQTPQPEFAELINACRTSILVPPSASTVIQLIHAFNDFGIEDKKEEAFKFLLNCPARSVALDEIRSLPPELLARFSKESGNILDTS